MNLKKYNNFLISALSIFIVDTCLTSCACQPKLPLLVNHSVILAFGDSLTFGTGAQPWESYPAVLEKIMGRRVINGGYPGETTDLALLRLPIVLDHVRPALLLLCTGGNDQRLNVSSQKATHNIRKMIQLAGEINVPVVLIAVPDLRLSSSGPPMYQKIAKEFCIPIEEESLSKIFADDSSFRTDIHHPNAQGYRLMAETIASLLFKTGAGQ